MFKSSSYWITLFLKIILKLSLKSCTNYGYIFDYYRVYFGKSKFYSYVTSIFQSSNLTS